MAPLYKKKKKKKTENWEKRTRNGSYGILYVCCEGDLKGECKEIVIPSIIHAMLLIIFNSTNLKNIFKFILDILTESAFHDIVIL